MAKTKVSEWSTTAASNTDIDGITLDGAVMTPSLVDNAVRELMEQIAAQLGDMGDKGADIASATTTNLASATGWYLDITGTTTITGFGTVNEGQLYMLRFSGVLTLTYNATSLILPGAASITTAAGDVAFMMSLGSGNWRCLVYQRASGLAGDVTLTGTQTLTNKSLSDSTTFLVDESDATKKVQFQLSGITTATTRTYTAPNSSGTIVLQETVPADAFSGFIGAPANKSYTLVLKCPYGGTINETVTKSASGTCTATFKINTTALGGTANSVSSSEQTQAHASANTFVAGDDIVLTISSNSSCLDMAFTIKVTKSF